MAFLNFMKKKEELPADIDLDMPPEPPKMMEKEISAKEPIDEELMPLKKPKKTKQRVKKFPSFPKEAEELPELPPLPKEEFEQLPEGLELPPPPKYKKERKGLFSFLKPKKAAEKLPLPEIEEFPEIPSLPEEEKEFPSLPEKEELPPMPELEKEMPVAPQPATPSFPEMPAPEPFKPVERPLPKREVQPIKKFITLNDFRQIQSDITNTKGILKGIDGFFSKLEEVKNTGDKEYAELHSSLQDIQSKLMFVDKTLFQEQSV